MTGKTTERNTAEMMGMRNDGVMERRASRTDRRIEVSKGGQRLKWNRRK